MSFALLLLFGVILPIAGLVRTWRWERRRAAAWRVYRQAERARKIEEKMNPLALYKE